MTQARDSGQQSLHVPSFVTKQDSPLPHAGESPHLHSPASHTSPGLQSHGFGSVVGSVVGPVVGEGGGLGGGVGSQGSWKARIPLLSSAHPQLPLSLHSPSTQSVQRPHAESHVPARPHVSQPRAQH
jgi:hypothetical protein